jgi:hypothetical protein
LPTALRRGPYRFQFFASDGSEPRHIHVSRDGADAKFWLDPEVRLAQNRGFTAKELRDIEKIIEDELQTLRDAWNDFFNP